MFIQNSKFWPICGFMSFEESEHGMRSISKLSYQKQTFKAHLKFFCGKIITLKFDINGTEIFFSLFSL